MNPTFTPWKPPSQFQTLQPSYVAPPSRVLRALMSIPRQPFRGFMLDTARNYFPVDVIKRQLDAMSWVKARLTHPPFRHRMLTRITTAKHFPLAHRRQSKF